MNISAFLKKNMNILVVIAILVMVVMIFRRKTLEGLGKFRDTSLLSSRIEPRNTTCPDNGIILATRGVNGRYASDTDAPYKCMKRAFNKYPTAGRKRFKIFKKCIEQACGWRLKGGINRKSRSVRELVGKVKERESERAMMGKKQRKP